MSSPGPAASQQAVVEAALVLLERMGLSPADLVSVPASRPEVPTFAEYAGAVGAFLYGVIRTGRWWRGIKLPGPKPRRAREQQPPPP